jgi:hypothetical protein
MTPIDFFFYLALVFFAFMVLPLLGTYWVRFMSRAQFYPWGRRGQTRRRL